MTLDGRVLEVDGLSEKMKVMAKVGMEELIVPAVGSSHVRRLPNVLMTPVNTVTEALDHGNVIDRNNKCSE